MKSSLLKMIAMASLVFAALGFAQETDDQGFYNYGQDPTQISEPEETAPKPKAKPKPQKVTPAKVQPQESVQENVQRNSDNNSQDYDSPAKKNRDMGVGIRVAFDYGMMYGFEETDDYVDEDPSGIGFEGGLAARIEMVNNLYFVPEVNFSYLSTKHKYLELDRTYTSMTLEIPLLMRGIIADRFYATAGPQLNLTLSSDFEQEYSDFEFGTMPEDFKEDVEQAGFTFGIAVGAGVRIYEGLFFDFRFYMGLTELFPDVKSMSDNILEADSFIDMAGAKMMTIKVGLSYWFI